MTTLSISLAMPRAALVSSDNFLSQASSMIWKVITKKNQRKNAQKSDKGVYLVKISPRGSTYHKSPKDFLFVCEWMGRVYTPINSF